MKNLVKITKLISVIFFVVILFSSCASTTLIESSPSGARVYLNDESVGVTPYTMRDSKIVWASTTVKLEKEGYKPFTTTIVKNEEPAVGPIIGGFFVTIPWLWFMKYKPTHNYVLLPDK